MGSPASAEEALLSKLEVAKRLSVTPRWVDRAIAEGRFPVVKIGGLVRVLPSDLDEYVTSCRRRPRASKAGH
jgi:excisionase family DNA binding protein